MRFDLGRDGAQFILRGGQSYGRFYTACRGIPGLQWVRGQSSWRGYADAIAFALLALGAPIPPALESDPIDGSGLTYSMGMRPYQITGADWIVKHAAVGCLLADDVGLGKSYQALRAAQSLGGKTLIAAPAFVQQVWRDEIERWVTPFTDSCTVVSYDKLWKLAGGWTTIIFDEAHYLMSIESQRSKAARALAAQAKYRIALTATPMTSRPRDLYNLVDTICPGRFGLNPWDYYRRYCDAHEEQVTEFRSAWKIDGSSHEEELNRRLRYFMLRRLKADVMTELPERERQIIRIDAGKVGMVGATTSKRALRSALDIAADKKFKDVVQLVDGHRHAGRKVVVFTHRRHIAEQLAAQLVTDVAVAHGGMPPEERRKKAGSKPDILCCTIDATGVGIDLSYASVVVFAELDWVPAKLIQAEGRVHRFGAATSVLVQYVIAMGSADELIARGVLAKLDSFARAVGGDGSGLAEDLSERDEDVLLRLYERIAKEMSI